MRSKKSIGVFILLLTILIGTFASVSASTQTLFEDDFDSYTYDSGLDLYDELENNDWFVHDEDAGKNDDDIYVSNITPENEGDKYLVVTDYSYVIAKFSTENYEDIILEYKRATTRSEDDEFRIRWRVGDGEWRLIEAFQDNHNAIWEKRVINLGSDAENKDLIQVMFYLEGYEGNLGLLDDVLVTGYLDEENPVCSVDFLEQRVSDNVYLFSDSRYIGEDGSFYVYGFAEDSESKIINVQYNRTSPDTRHIYSGADSVDGAFNELKEDWRSDKDDFGYIDGWHTVCCRATDDENNRGDGTCETFCIDTQDPETPVVDLDNEFLCEYGYTNEEISFSWEDVESNGCAPIAYYNIEVSDDEEVSSDSRTETNYPISGVNEHTYLIRVQAVDEAGNEGDWSEWSEQIIFDDDDPEVQIGTPNQGTWFNSDFLVNETDEDNLGLYRCEYMIKNNGEIIVDWTETACNSDVLVEVPEFCEEETCTVYKKAIDYACNENQDYEWYKIDLTAPTTTKTVSDPKYPGRLFEWLGQYFDLDWFVTNATTITLECVDGNPELSGCDETYYRLKYNNGSWSDWILYEGSFSLYSGDGIYEVEYYSVDNVGNEEIVQYEIDKVDTEAPTTTKTIGEPKYEDEEKLWITSNTNLTFICTDSEVGCDEICVNQECIPTNLSIKNIEGDDGEYIVNYYSTDLLGNIEDDESETDFLDNTKPNITIHNPTGEEAENVERCVQSIVVSVDDGIGSGVNEESVYAQLWYGEEKVREVQLTKSIYNTYEGLMDKQLPAGNYSLKIIAEDNLENSVEESLGEYLAETVFVEYISPAWCNVDPILGGSCDFTFNVCMRGANSVQFWMDKLGDVVTPDMMSARILSGIGENASSAFVGLEHEGYTSEAEILQIGEECEEINGRTSFQLHLEMNDGVVFAIGPGAHGLDYRIESSLQPEGECEILEAR